MGRSKETFSKKEKEKKRIKKRQDKESKMEERKATTKDTSLESMLAYVDENGNLSATPPDPRVKREINLEDIQLGAADSHAPSEPIRHEGRIDTFFQDKGFGFIKDTHGKSVFVHVSALDDTMDVGDRISFETEQTPKGVSAVNVRRADATPPPPPAPPAPPATPAP